MFYPYTLAGGLSLNIVLLGDVHVQRQPADWSMRSTVPTSPALGGKRINQKYLRKVSRGAGRSDQVLSLRNGRPLPPPLEKEDGVNRCRGRRPWPSLSGPSSYRTDREKHHMDQSRHLPSTTGCHCVKVRSRVLWSPFLNRMMHNSTCVFNWYTSTNNLPYTDLKNSYNVGYNNYNQNNAP